MRKLFTTLLLFTLLLTLAPQYKAEAASGQDLVNIAKKYLKVPYRFGGTTPSGFDCSGFIYYIFKQVGIDVPRVSADQAKIGTTVSKAELKPGDLVFFSNTYKAGISHTGIYIGDNQFISATNSGITIDSMESSYWKPKYTYGKRVSGLAYDNSIFSDVASSNPIYKAITSLNSGEIIMGYNDGTFKPNDSVTRGQAAAIINRVLKLTALNSNVFTDVHSNNPFANDIAAIQQAGIINGYTDGTFRPYDEMTRAQMAIIVQRAFELKQAEFAIAGNEYGDVPSSYWAYEAINIMNRIDTTSVYKTSNFRAISDASRGDFSAAIYNAINYTN